MLARAMRTLLLSPLRWYQRVLSPLKGAPTCRYLPTCSSYAIEAIETHGAAVGGAMAAARLLRCNPLFHGGYHPVPPARARAIAAACACDHGDRSSAPRTV